MSGSFISRKVFNNEEVMGVVGLGFQLLYPLPYEKVVNKCGGVGRSFAVDQMVFKVYDYQMKADIAIGIPCREYPEAYLVSYAPLAKTWLY